MGNYIYGYMTPLGKSFQTVEDTNTTTETVEEVKAEVKAEAKAEANTDEKSIHPYLIEYGTVMYDSIMINNTAYKYKK